MIIYIGKIPGNISANELHHFVKSACKIGFFGISTSVRRLEVIKVVDKFFDLAEYHSLVYMDSDSVGLRVIRKLNGKSIKDQPVEVREYCAWRKLKNDRRTQHEFPLLSSPDKRGAERRRENERLETQICGVIQRIQKIN